MKRNAEHYNWTDQNLKNRLHTFLLLAGMLMLSSLTGWLFAGPAGMMWVLIATVISLLVAPRLSPQLMMRWFKARPLAPVQAQSLYATLRELSRRAGLPNMPTLYYVPTPKLSAFTAGSRNDAVIAITGGLMRTLNSRELTAVLAHEISHLKNNDLWMMNVSATFSQITSVLATIGQLLLILNLPMLMLTDHHIPWIGILVLMLAPSLAMMLQLALSRTREFDADLGAAELTQDPKALASALLKIEQVQRGWMGRIPWLGRRGRHHAIWNTHPATQDRVDRLIADAGRSPKIRSRPHWNRRLARGLGGRPIRIVHLTG